MAFLIWNFGEHQDENIKDLKTFNGDDDDDVWIVDIAMPRDKRLGEKEMEAIKNYKEL